MSNSFYTTDYAYEELANAIIKQAIADYRFIVRKMKRLDVLIKAHREIYPLEYDMDGNKIEIPEERNYKKAEESLKEILVFFRSKWFSVLTEVNPDIIIEQLHKEAAYES